MGWFSFILVVCFVKWLPAGATVPRIALLSIALPAICCWKSLPISRGVLLLCAYFTVMALVAPNWYFALPELWLFLLWVMAFCIGRTLVDLRPVFIGAAIGLWINSAVVLLAEQSTTLFVRGGLFLNHNSAVEATAMVLAGLVVYRAWIWLPGLLPSLFSGGKAPLVALALVSLLVMWRRAPRLALALCGAGLVAFMAVLWSQNFYLGGWHERVGVWQDTFVGLSAFGHGLGSFDYEFPALQRHSDPLQVRFDHPHFELLQIAYELGVPGVALVSALGVYLWRQPRSPAWCALAVFFVEGCAAFPLYLPVTGYLAAICLGHIVGAGERACYAVDAGRHSVRPWTEDLATRSVRPSGEDVFA